MVALDERIDTTGRGDGRERILDEARNQFLTKGYAATSMQEIADAVGMTKPALYYHFRDKQDLLVAVLGREMAEGQRAFYESLARHTSLADRLEFGATWCFSRIKGDLGRLMSDMHRVLPADKLHQFKCNHPMPVDMVTEILRESRENGELTDPEDPEMLARLFVSMIFGQLAMQQGEVFACLEPEDLGRLVARIFVSGISIAER
ncbi:MAG: TetR/AcrR family transcriptional regulator [Chloroflexota bacterium]|nr:TetR/AcrR family transcriptional regulator [Chloroflexota bacterium]